MCSMPCLRRLFLVTLLLAWPTGCSQPTGTFVRLNFTGSVNTNKPFQSIALDLVLGTRTATTTFKAPGQADLVLPTSAILEIQSGEGGFTVSARALAVDGTVLGTGTGSGTVARGKTSEVTVQFGGTVADGGVDGPASPDVPPSGFDAIADVSTELSADLPTPADVPGLSDLPMNDVTNAGGAGGDGGTDASGAGGASDAGGVGGAGGAGGLATGGGSGTGGSGTGGDSGSYRLSVNPTSIDFGAIVIGGVSPAQSLTITNLGTAPTPQLSFVVADPSHFPVFNNTCGTGFISAGGSCTLSFTFNPNAPGPLQTDGSISPADGTPVKFTLSGTGANGTAVLNLSPTALDFQVVDVGQTRSLDVTLTNSGNGDAGNITILSGGSPAFQVTSNHCANVPLGRLSQCSFTLTFSPSMYGRETATITVRSSSGAATSLSAAGTARDYVALTIQFAGTGNGVITGTNPTCASGSMCTITIPRTDPAAIPKIVLTAQPDGLSQFGGWSGDCAGTGTCAVVMDVPRSVTATFNPRTVQLNLTVLGLAGQTGKIVSQDGAITCGGNCPGLTPPNSGSITLNAKPGPSSTFVGWTNGPCQGTSPQCTFSLTDTTFITATFGPQSYIFLSSSQVVPGQLGGIDGGDRECQRLAGSANLPGNYRAWLSTAGTDARSRVGQGGWVRTDGRPFARNVKSLADPIYPVAYYPPRIDENGNDLGGHRVYVATGGNQDGTALGSQCADYTSTTGSVYVGEANAGAFAWAMTQLDSAGCGSAYHIYCFRSDALVADLAPPPQDGRRAFVSSIPFVPGGGVSPDVMCQKDADAAYPANTGKFIAFLATSSGAALKRLAASGPPWKRPDDVFVVRQISDLASGKLLAPIDLVADGSTYTNSYVWSGASDPTVTGQDTCADWSSNAATYKTLAGDSMTSATPDWFNNLTLSCTDATTRLMCVEQ